MAAFVLYNAPIPEFLAMRGEVKQWVRAGSYVVQCFTLSVTLRKSFDPTEGQYLCDIAIAAVYSTLAALGRCPGHAVNIFFTFSILLVLLSPTIPLRAFNNS